MTDRRELEENARDLGRRIAAGLPRGVGFVLFLYDFGDAGNMAYLANGKRVDVINALKEFIVKVELGEI